MQTADTEAETRFMAPLAKLNPRVRGVVGWVGMEAHDAPDRLAALAQDPLLRGIRPMWQSIPDDDWFLYSRQDRTALFGGTAVQFYGLRDPAGTA